MQLIKARFRNRDDFLQAWNDELEHGGMFCATTQELEAGQEVLIQVHFPGLPNKTTVKAKVLSWRAALPRLRVRAGAMVEFSAEESDKRDFICAVAKGEAREAIKRKHARLPIELNVSWTRPNSNETNQAVLREISIGGALLVTDMALELEEDLLLSVKAPGGAQPIAIAGKVTNKTSQGYGLRFIYRDAGGSRRLRELVRRLTE